MTDQQDGCERVDGEQFVHLHLHTDYSLLDGCATPETYADAAKGMGQTALAVTDHGDLGASFRFWDVCRQRGLKPIIGCEVYVNANRHLHPINKTLQKRIEKVLAQASQQEKAVYAEEFAQLIEEAGQDNVQDCEAQARSLSQRSVRQFLGDSEIDKDDFKRFQHLKEMQKAGAAAQEEDASTVDYKTKDKHLVLLAKDEVGFRNLSTIVSEAHMNGFYRKPRTTPDIIERHSEGLICLSACLGSETSRAIVSGDMDEARRIMRRYKRIFGGDYYAELQSNELDDQKKVDYGLLELADELGIKKVATVDCHYCKRGDDQIQDALMAKQRRTRVTDPNMWKFDARRLWLKNIEEIVGEYDEFGYRIAPSDVRSACANTLEVAEKCDGDYMEWGQFQFPAFDTGGETPDEMLKRLCDEGLRWRLQSGFVDPQQRKDYDERLATELHVICDKEFSTYFLVVWDMVKWAKDNGIFVGSGRGSVAGSLVAYVLRITEVDPLRFGLIFERFLNAERSGRVLRVNHKKLVAVRAG